MDGRTVHEAMPEEGGAERNEWQGDGQEMQGEGRAGDRPSLGGDRERGWGRAGRTMEHWESWMAGRKAGARAEGTMEGRASKD